MTTSRIYAYRWPARLVSHKPFAAERYFITSACNWQVFFAKKHEFSFLFSPHDVWTHFLCKNAQSPPLFFSGKPRRILGWLCPACFMPFYIKKPSPAAGPAGNSFPNHFFCFSRSANSSRGVTYTVVYTSYSTMPGLAPLAFQMFFTSVVSTATFAPVPALNALE